MEDLDQEPESREPEKDDYPVTTEVTLQDCQGKPPFPHHLMGQQVSRLLAMTIEVIITSLQDGCEVKPERYTQGPPEVRIEVGRTSEGRREEVPCSLYHSSQEPGETEPKDTEDADVTVTEPPHDGECTDQSHSSNQKVVSSTDPIPQYHPYQSHTSVSPLDTWFVPLSGCTGRRSLTRGHQALSCECTHIPPRWLCLIELSSYPCRGPPRRVTLTRHFESVLTRQLQLQMVLSSPTRYCHCCSPPCRISNSAVRSTTSSHACDLS